MRKFVDKHIEIDIPKRCKKLTGTRFASALGLDKWNTPFKTWCAITKTYEDSFTDNIYTIAGKTIEPKIIAYLNKAYFLNSVKSPIDIYGEGYFQRTHLFITMMKSLPLWKLKRPREQKIGLTAKHPFIIRYRRLCMLICSVLTIL